IRSFSAVKPSPLCGEAERAILAATWPAPRMRRGAGQSLGSGEAGVGQRDCGYGWDGPAVGAALAAAERSVPAVVELARRVAEIPAPTFEEAERAAFVRDRFAEAGLAPEGDAAGN